MKINNSPLSNVNNANKKVAFSGKIPGANTVKKLFEPLATGAMSRELFILNAFVFLLGGRIFASRDGNEKRETIIRDVPTILLAVGGVPVFKNFIAKKINDKSGFSIGHKSVVEPSNKPSFVEKATDWFRKTILRAKSPREKFSMASNTQLRDWYILDEMTEKSVGFEGFMKRFDKLGSNFKKVISSLSDEIKTAVSGFKPENGKFMEELSANKELKEKIVAAFKNPKNKACEKAIWSKTVPSVVGFASTLLLIGLCIPKLNIFITEQINKNKKAGETPSAEAQKLPEEVQSARLKALQNIAAKENKKAFASFSGANL